jgi:hypothetical protein
MDGPPSSLVALARKNMANRSGQWKLPDPINPSTGWNPRSTKWAWLEFVMPLFAVALLVVFFKPEYVPRVFLETATSPAAWVAWTLLGAVGGVLTFSGLLVAFFLLYSPVYLAGKLPALTGKGGWTDSREIRFYGLCFFVLLALVGLLFFDWQWFVAAFLIVTGFAPVLWRALV